MVKPCPPALFYCGKVMHQRLKPKKHRFSYSVFSLFIDLDRLEPASQLSRFFSVNQFNLISFYERDHGLQDGSPLENFVKQKLVQHGMPAEDLAIYLFCYPRLLGYVFNPLSVYYCIKDDRLVATLYEVRNTFGGIHHYCLPFHDTDQKAEKAFRVSPFLDMNMTYRFRVNRPDDTLKIHILESDVQGPILAASFSGWKKAITTVSSVKLFLSYPLMTLKVISAIHWEAARLWWKGVRG